jgi:hypothetical protein
MSSPARGLKKERKTSRRERGHQAELYHAGRSARTIMVKILARRNGSSISFFLFFLMSYFYFILILNIPIQI